jgi:hypothetical protein
LACRTAAFLPFLHRFCTVFHFQRFARLRPLENSQIFDELPSSERNASLKKTHRKWRKLPQFGANYRNGGATNQGRRSTV